MVVLVVVVPCVEGSVVVDGLELEVVVMVGLGVVLAVVFVVVIVGLGVVIGVVFVVFVVVMVDVVAAVVIS